MTKNAPHNELNNLQPMEQLLLWRLALAGGAWLKDLKPTPDTKHRATLKAVGLVTEEKRKPEQGGPAATFLDLTDAGWNWLGSHATEPMNLSPRATTAPTLEAIVLKLGRYLEANQGNLADFLYPSQGSHPLTDKQPSLETVAGRVAAAYRKLADGRKAVRVRLADLRDELSDVSRDVVDRALVNLAADGTAALYQLDNPLEIEPRDHEAALRTPSGDVRHILYMDRESA